MDKYVIRRIGIIKNTEKALLVKLRNKKTAWIPVSQIEVMWVPEHQAYTSGLQITVKMPEWLLKNFK